jgi:hypothetical protein
MDQPYNRQMSAHPLIKRVTSWAEITAQIGV